MKRARRHRFSRPERQYAHSPHVHPSHGTPTRLHVRYDAAHFPEDLTFQETGDRQNFQARYVLRHPWKETQQAKSCPATDQYRKDLARRQETEAQTLATLTGWRIEDIRRSMGVTALDDKKWWQRLWGG